MSSKTEEISDKYSTIQYRWNTRRYLFTYNLGYHPDPYPKAFEWFTVNK